MAESLVPPETRALIGQRLSEPVSGTLTAKHVAQYAHAVGDLNPLYFDEEAAKAAGYRTCIAPPTLISHVVVSSRPLGDLREDGIPKGGGGRRVTLNVKRVMFGGEEWEFLAPACVGDTITAETRLKDLEEKSGSSGPFVLQTMETTYTNQLGEVVARSQGRSIAR